MRRMTTTCLCLATALTVLWMPVVGSSQVTEYKEYKGSPARVPYFRLTYDSKLFRVTLDADSVKPQTKSFPTASLVINQTSVMSGKTLLFDSLGAHFGDSTLPYDQIRDVEVSDSDDGTIIRFYRSPGDLPRSQMIRRGNRISFADSITVREGEFVRGAVVTVLGNLHVAGEVNRNVVSLFGAITVSPSAVIRGDLATVRGTIIIAKTAQIYGDTYKGEKKSVAWRHRFFRQDHPVEPNARLGYDRVDGFAPYLSVAYHDRDSLLPSVRAEVGYAFASSRWRLSLGAEQMIWHNRPLWVGAEYYRSLASDDDWMLPNWENSIYAALVTEDFKDFYEAEGGTAFVRFKPIKPITFVGRYRNEQTNWLRAHRHLSSVFGGEKIFPDNFGSVDSAYREQGIKEIDTGSNVTLSAQVQYDTRHDDSLFSFSAWNNSASMEWSSTDFNSDFNYRRWVLDIRRYQVVHRYSMLLLRGMLAGSDGYLPMNRRYFLGGPGSLYGYERKELMGSRFWMVNAEYRFQIPKTEVAFGALWDMAQIANDHKLNGDIEVKNSIGAAVYFGDKFRLSVARRLDRSNVSPEIYVRLGSAF